jgi:tRNA A37 methylthiotransferase MiaB
MSDERVGQRDCDGYNAAGQLCSVRGLFCDCVYVIFHRLCLSAESENDADIVFINTCSIREKAEQKIWSRLAELRHRKMNGKPDLTVGVLGCMAERLKSTLLEGALFQRTVFSFDRKAISGDQMVDLVVGPDAYKTLPQLLQVVGENERQVFVLTIVFWFSIFFFFLTKKGHQHGVIRG